jgi:phosphopantetheinyl transferase
MKSVYTRYATIAELPLGTPDAWLSPYEAAIWLSIRSAPRRDSWLAGRIVLKELLREAWWAVGKDLTEWQPSAVEIMSRTTSAGRGDRPTARGPSGPMPCSLSLAHTQRGVLAALAVSENCSVGVDLVRPADAESLTWVFSDLERQWIRRSSNQAVAAARLWGMKEALYKACQRGEGFAPLNIDVTPGHAPCMHGIDTTMRLFAQQCWSVDGQIAVLVVTQPENERDMQKRIPHSRQHAA